jgi:hypothetical protein
VTLHLEIYLSQKIKDNFRGEAFSLLELRRHIHHLTRMPDIVIRSIVDDLLAKKFIILKKVDGEKPKYDIDTETIEYKVLTLNEKNLNELKRRYKIQDE